jgi:hypothetical protein
MGLTTHVAQRTGTGLTFSDNKPVYEIPWWQSGIVWAGIVIAVLIVAGAVAVVVRLFRRR